LKLFMVRTRVRPPPMVSSSKDLLLDGAPCFLSPSVEEGLSADSLIQKNDLRQHQEHE
jgi:hypothetical protein